MSFFVSTAMGFITADHFSEENPKSCINQNTSRDVRCAFPFRSWDAANRFATRLTTHRLWPNDRRYFAVLSPMSPNTVMLSPVAEAMAPIPVPAPAVRRSITDRVRAFIAS